MGQAVGECGGVNPGVASSTSVGAASPGRPDWRGLATGDANGVGEPSSRADLDCLFGPAAATRMLRRR